MQWSDLVPSILLSESVCFLATALTLLWIDVISQLYSSCCEWLYQTCVYHRKDILTVGPLRMPCYGALPNVGVLIVNGRLQIRYTCDSTSWLMSPIWGWMGGEGWMEGGEELICWLKRVWVLVLTWFITVQDFYLAQTRRHWIRDYRILFPQRQV